jgi:hypothetical protein
MSDKSSQLLEDLHKSNQEMDKFAITLNTEHEEEKGEIDEGGINNANISELPRMFKTNSKQPENTKVNLSFKSNEFKSPKMIYTKTDYLYNVRCKICGQTPSAPFYDYKDYRIAITSLKSNEYQQMLLEFYMQSESISMKNIISSICEYLDDGRIIITLGEFRKNYSAITSSNKFSKYDAI